MARERVNNPWRQGFALTAEDAKALNLVHRMAGDDPITIVVSHDCDMQAAEKTEPNWEVIPGYFIPKLVGRYTKAKHPRILHLSLSGGEVLADAEFDVRNRLLIPRSKIVGCQPTTIARPSPSERGILQTWLSARYRRSAFADGFISRFAQNNELYSEFEAIIDGTAIHLQKVCFDVDSGLIVERHDADDAYSLTIHLIFDVETDPNEAEIAASTAAEKITELFKKHFLVDGAWKHIHLIECWPRAESVFSLFEHRLYQEWQFDYLSLEDLESE